MFDSASKKNGAVTTPISNTSVSNVRTVVHEVRPTKPTLIEELKESIEFFKGTTGYEEEYAAAVAELAEVYKSNRQARLNREN